MTSHEDLKRYKEIALQNFEKYATMTKEFEEFLTKEKVIYNIDKSYTKSKYYHIKIKQPAYEDDDKVTVRISDHVLPKRHQSRSRIDFYLYVKGPKTQEVFKGIKNFIIEHAIRRING